MTYHRFTRSETCDTGCGFMMFSDDEGKVDHYGDKHWVFSGEGAIDAVDLIDAAREAGFEDQFYDAELLNPVRIDDTAAAWDDLDAVMWIWENVCEARGWHAIRTNDGAIIFDPALAIRVED